MGFDQKGASVFCVSPGADSQWDVTEEGFEQPLASFKSSAEAQEYARDLARKKEGSTIKLFGQDGKQTNDGQTAALLRA